MSDYTPIPEEAHAELELAIIRRRRLRLALREGGMWRLETVTPIDLETRDGVEYLVAADGRGRRRIRLDRIFRFEPLV